MGCNIKNLEIYKCKFVDLKRTMIGCRERIYNFDEYDLENAVNSWKGAYSLLQVNIGQKILETRETVDLKARIQKRRIYNFDEYNLGNAVNSRIQWRTVHDWSLLFVGECQFKKRCELVDESTIGFLFVEE